MSQSIQFCKKSFVVETDFVHSNRRESQVTKRKRKSID